jgi:hypothetical protein
VRQLEFNLTPRAEHHGSIEPWLYRFERGTLLEEIGSRRFVYGLWDKLFGCWEIDTASHSSREIVPTWVPLNSKGVWRDNLEIRAERPHHGDYKLSPKWLYEANSAFAALLSSIPLRIRRIAAPCEHLQWLVLDMIWQVPDFAYFLDDEFYNNTQQYVFACLSLSNAILLPRDKRRQLASLIMTTKRPILLSHLSGIKCKRETTRLLNKLGPRPYRPAVYEQLLRLSNSDPFGKVFHHVREIEVSCLKIIAALPDGFLTHTLARIVLENPEECEALLWFDDYEAGEGFRAVVDMYPEISKDWQEKVRQSLTTVKSVNDLPSWGERWAYRLAEAVNFPPPPFLSFRNLLPLSTPKAVRQEARTMQNCISRMIGRVLSRETYFYSWDCAEPATVMIEQVDSRWKLSEAHGYRNRDLSPETLKQLKLTTNAAINVSEL